MTLSSAGTLWNCLCSTGEYQGLAVRARPAPQVRGSFSLAQVFVSLRASVATKPSLNFSLILHLNLPSVQADLFVQRWWTVFKSSALLLFLDNIHGQPWPCPGPGLHDLGSRGRIYSDLFCLFSWMETNNFFLQKYWAALLLLAP